MSIYVSELDYCVYITIYSGNKMPPFYIGYTKTSNIANGYRGTVKSKKYIEIWKSELKNNPQLFKTVILSYHNDKKDAICKEQYFQKKLDVLNKPTIYINRSIGMYNNDIVWNKGKSSKTDDRIEKYAKKIKGDLHWNVSGKNNPMFGKKHKKITIEINRIKAKERWENTEKYNNVVGKYIITTPNGETVKIVNLSKYCRENGLNRTLMDRVANTEKNYKGYYVKNDT